MKTNLVIIMLYFISVNYLLSQDVLLKKDGTELKVKVTEISQNEIKYKNLENIDGPLYILNRSDVLSIQYQNGLYEKFDSTNINIETIQNKIINDSFNRMSDIDLYNLGQLDASQNYYKYNGASTGTLITSLVSPIAGLIPAIACASTDPKDKNLNYPNIELTKKEDYVKGYKAKAKSIKINKIWKSWAFGLFANVVAYFLIVR